MPSIANAAARFRRNMPVLVCLVVALSSLWLTLPQLAVAWLSLPAAQLIYLIESGANTSESSYAYSLEKLEAALAVNVNTAATRDQIRYLRFEWENNSETHSLTKSDLQTIVQHAENGLAKRPVDAFIWTGYAHALYRLEGMSNRTILALSRSYQYGRYERSLTHFRLVLALNEWEKLPAEQQVTTLHELKDRPSAAAFFGNIYLDLPPAPQKLFLSLLDAAEIDEARVLGHADWLKRQREKTSLQAPAAN